MYRLLSAVLVALCLVACGGKPAANLDAQRMAGRVGQVALVAATVDASIFTRKLAVADAPALGLRVIDYLKAHPKEVLNTRDIATKFGVPAAQVAGELEPAVEAGQLQVKNGGQLGMLYRAGSTKVAFPQPFTPSLTEAVRRNRATRRAKVQVDFAAIKIEKGIPLIEPMKRTARWKEVFDRMEPGNSFALPNSAREALMHARLTYLRDVKKTKNFVIRKVESPSCVAKACGCANTSYSRRSQASSL